MSIRMSCDAGDRLVFVRECPLPVPAGVIRERGRQFSIGDRVQYTGVCRFDSSCGCWEIEYTPVESPGDPPQKYQAVETYFLSEAGWANLEAHFKGTQPEPSMAGVITDDGDLQHHDDKHGEPDGG